VGIRVGGDKTRAAGDKVRCFMHHLPVKGSRFTHNHKIGIHISDGKACFVQFVDQRTFAHYIGFFPFLAPQKISRRHRRGVKHAVRHVYACRRKAVRQILTGLGRVVREKNQWHSFVDDAVKELSSTRHGNVIVHQHAVDITNYILNGHGLSDIKKRRNHYTQNHSGWITAVSQTHPRQQ
jgi:hypothetical protein